ncbi:MAG: HEPN domain-containing protein [Candidatus Omnitrophica bacterium]|nr:HEPN domain-containing protein [Candidatus Omnitrophota bacterium]
MIYKQFIQEYEARGMIKKQRADVRAMGRLIRRALKEIEIAKLNLAIDEGTAYTVTYTAMLHAARAFMLLKGYRPSDGYQHKTVVDFTEVALGAKYKTVIQHFDKMRRKRNLFTYELTISISPTEAKSALKTAKEFVDLIRGIIEEENPQAEFKF